VPGLAGKGIIDLLLAAPPAHIPATTKALLELGFQHQSPAAFPPTRPMLWGTFRHGATEYGVHVHVVPTLSPEVAAMRGFRDALRADPVLRRRYAALKRAIVAGGPADPVAFTKAKHDWIAATLAHLGLADDPPRRLYQDDLDPDGATGARRPPTARQDPPLWSSRTTARNEGVPVPMQPIHRLAHLAQQSDGGTEWACPECGRYLIRYPDTELVLAAGAPGPVHVLGSRYRVDPTEVPTVSEFDQQFLHRHAMAWSTDHRPN
jgi:hypothetical protein